MCALAIAAWAVERHELRVQLNRAWGEAVNGGLANPANLDVGLLNRAAQVRVAGFALTALFVGLAVAPVFPHNRSRRRELPAAASG